MADANINILQWNIHGIRPKAHHIRAAADLESVDILLLQETLLRDATYEFTGFQTFLLPRGEEHLGLATLVRNTLPATKVVNPPDCGEGNEVLGVRVKTSTREITVYNVYRKQQVDFVVDELFSTAQYETVIIGGDFNAHHHRINPTLGKINEAGTQIISMLC